MATRLLLQLVFDDDGDLRSVEVVERIRDRYPPPPLPGQTQLADYLPDVDSPPDAAAEAT